MNPEILKKTFDKFWQAYPKKANPVYARQCWERKWKKSPLSKEKFEKIMSALEQQKKHEWHDKTFIPNASTWINQERWESAVECTEPKEGDNEFVSRVMRPLMEFYNKPLTDKQVEHWVEMIQHVALKDAISAVAAIKLSEQWFPTPKVFLDRVEACRARRTQIELRSDKNGAQRFFSEDGKSEVATDHIRLINRMLSMPNGVEKTEFCLESYRALARKYPEANYGDMIAKYERELNG